MCLKRAGWITDSVDQDYVFTVFRPNVLDNQILYYLVLVLHIGLVVGRLFTHRFISCTAHANVKSSLFEFKSL